LRPPHFTCFLAGIVLAACSDGTSNLLDPAEGYRASLPVWVQQPPTVAGAADFADLWMRPDGAEGWAVAGSMILHLQSGKWHADTIRSGPPVEWRSIAFRSDTTMGFAVGEAGWIAQRDTRHQWSARRVAPETTELTSVWVDDRRQEAFAVGRGGVALRWSQKRWDRLRLRHDSAQGILLDVVATDRELWVRDSALIAIYDRRDLTWLQDLTGYRTSRLWTQPSSARVWFTGVTQPAYRADRYAVFSAGADRTDTIKGVWVLPRAAWMGQDPQCGLVTGDGEDTERAVEPPYSVYITGEPTGPYASTLPQAVDIRALWVNPDCTTGWAVGLRGYVARLGHQRLDVDSMTQEGGRVELLTGRYALVLDSGVPTPEVDSLHLIHDDAIVRLTEGQHFTMDAKDGSPVAVRISDAGRIAAQAFADQKVKLRFFVSYRGSVPAYTVAYDRDGSFYLGGKSLLERNRRKILTAIVTCAVLLLLWSLPRARWVRRLVFTAQGQAVLNRLKLGGLPEAYAYALTERSALRWKFFRHYRQQLQKELPSSGAHLPAVDVVDCGVASNETRQSAPAEQWKGVMQDLLSTKKGVLWVEDVQGAAGRELLLHWAGVALKHKLIPVRVDLSKSRPIADEIRGEWDRLGSIPAGVPALWEAGGFVLLLDGSRGYAPTDALLRFIEDERERNVVVVSSSVTPPISGVCHLRLREPGP
jgi:hypothetical protein